MDQKIKRDLVLKAKSLQNFAGYAIFFTVAVIFLSIGNKISWAIQGTLLSFLVNVGKPDVISNMKKDREDYGESEEAQ